MKVIYNIKVEKELTETEKDWLVEHNINTSEELTSHILDNEEFSNDLLNYLDATKLLNFNVEIVNANM